MYLYYDPDKFLEDKKYLEGTHNELLENALKEEFPKNYKRLRKINVGITKTYVTNQSNIYSKKVKYDKDLSYLKGRKNELSALEKYANLNLRCLFWNYIDKNKELKSRALHASDFFIEVDYLGALKNVIVRAGSFHDSEGNLNYLFYAYNNETKKITKKTAKNWLMLGDVDKDGIITKELSVDTWELFDIDNPELSTFEALPFTLFSKDAVTEPHLSPIPALENLFSNGFAFADFTSKISFLKKAVLQTDMPESDVNIIAETFGLSGLLTKIGKQDMLSFLDTGTLDNQLNYIVMANNILTYRAACDGVDKNALLNDTKVESGYARRLQMLNILEVRAANIVLWEQFEERNWKVIKSLGFDVPTKVEYDNFDLLDELEEIDYKGKKFELYRNAYSEDAITKVEFIAFVRNLIETHEISDENMNEAEKILKGIQDVEDNNPIIENNQNQNDNDNNQNDNAE